MPTVQHALCAIAFSPTSVIAAAGLREERRSRSVVALAAELGIDPIVMGTTATGRAHFLLGSVAERRARSSAAPVLSVRRRADA